MIPIGIEMDAARAVAAANLLSRALHDPADGWTFRVTEDTFRAQRIIREDGVLFTGRIRTRTPGNTQVDLYSGEVMVSSQQIEFPEAGEFDVNWLIDAHPQSVHS